MYGWPSHFGKGQVQGSPRFITCFRATQHHTHTCARAHVTCLLLPGTSKRHSSFSLFVIYGRAARPLLPTSPPSTPTILCAAPGTQIKYHKWLVNPQLRPTQGPRFHRHSIYTVPVHEHSSALSRPPLVLVDRLMTPHNTNNRLTVFPPTGLGFAPTASLAGQLMQMERDDISPVCGGKYSTRQQKIPDNQ
jgi:hypothetical protein